jgi:hypothetical protein
MVMLSASIVDPIKLGIARECLQTISRNESSRERVKLDTKEPTSIPGENGSTPHRAPVTALSELGPDMCLGSAGINLFAVQWE